MNLVIHTSLQTINQQQWNGLLKDNNPFMRYEFLYGLEVSACVSNDKGWQAQYICLEDENQCLQAVMPCYIKTHSYGEYIFDWAWADAYHRNGLNYYPKLSNAVPFTPATGPRYLATNETLFPILLEGAFKLVKEQQLSSFHSLFLNKQQYQQFKQAGLLTRHSNQFHWSNQHYTDFNDFLSKLSSKKRKNIKRERRRVRDAHITYRWISGDELSSEEATLMNFFYLRTIHYYGAQAYLTPAFFDYLIEHFKQHTLMLFAYYKNKAIAGALYFKSDNTLYGRYWGALDNYHSLHFETCYYQAIQWCIDNGYQYFEAGAQGEHKLARGLTPVTTYSAHWIEHADFRSAIADFLKQEKNHLTDYSQHLQQHSPFRFDHSPEHSSSSRKEI